MADIAVVLGRLTPPELDGLRSLGPHGHLTRPLIEALDRAAGGPGAGRGYYVPNGNVSATGGPHLVLRSDVAGWLFDSVPQMTQVQGDG
ncbi:hypothetical protein [Arthrobacter sp. SO5]|uniref:hypothetical protein n=1 Tax=Arthrobacter sp. SO5 TaxID=1897055 RepID=UPI001E2923EA|nr:hypothetical protein [Arthrobacter sp. SO5]